MKRFDTAVTSNRAVSDGYREMSFVWPADTAADDAAAPAAGPKSSAAQAGGLASTGAAPGDPLIAGLGAPAPGRFFTVRAGSGHDPAIRRPFAFSGWAPSRGGAGLASFVFQERGRGTAYLASLKPGDALDVLGPLGRGFSPPPAGTRPVLLAGGIGVGPMLYLARALASEADAGRCEAPVLALGFRRSSLIPGLDLPQGTALCTDDGSAGFKGSVIDWLSGFDPGMPPALYACGPKPMMAAAAAYAEARGLRCEAALEQWMACGLGACAGCAVPLKSGGYLKACSDGPVVDAALVDWEAYR